MIELRGRLEVKATHPVPYASLESTLSRDLRTTMMDAAGRYSRSDATGLT